MQLEHGRGCCGTAMGPTTLKLAVSKVRTSRFGVVCLGLDMKQDFLSVERKNLCMAGNVIDECRVRDTDIAEVLEFRTVNLLRFGDICDDSEGEVVDNTAVALSSPACAGSRGHRPTVPRAGLRVLRGLV